MPDKKQKIHELTSDEVNNLRGRIGLIENYQNTTMLLQREVQFYISELQKKYGCSGQVTLTPDFKRLIEALPFQAEEKTEEKKEGTTNASNGQL